MADVSLTDFVDFVISSGTPKLTKVSQVKNRGEYHPAFDFWRILREGIIEFHQRGSTNKKELDDLLKSVKGVQRQNRYPDCIASYKRFLGRKSIEWFSPPRGEWGPRGIKIRINPELGLIINGTPHIIKLYFKKETLSKRKIDIILLLLQTTLSETSPNEINFSVLDVPRAKFYPTNNANAALLPLLLGEANSFLTIWESI